jgi:hypothetical protein
MDARSGRNRIHMQSACAVLAAFIANDPHHGLFAPCEPRR